MDRKEEAQDFLRYRKLQEDWVTGLTGGSFVEIIGLTAVSLASFAFWKAFIQYSPSRSIFVEYVVLVFPFLVAIGWPQYGIPLGGILFLLAVLKGSSAPKLDTSKEIDRRKLHDIVNTPRKPYLVFYRAIMMIYTCACILAVDFPLFPRRFAKVEAYGISLMDVGVGAFVFSQGVVYGRHLHREPTRGDMLKSVIASIPLVILGFGRLYLVKATNYQEHVSEYGEHWNFFFTLAVLAPFVSVVRYFFSSVDSALVALVIIIGYQTQLSMKSLEDFIIHAPRVDFVSRNREGLFSTFGYVTIFFFAAKLGQSLFEQRHSAAWNKKTLPILVIISVLLMSLYLYLSQFFPTSRRMANLMYVWCTVAYGVLMVTASAVVEAAWGQSETTAELLEAVNRNQLFVFLVANILTGLTNQSVQTLYVEDKVAFGIWNMYMTLVLLVAMIFHRLNVTMKFW